MDVVSSRGLACLLVGLVAGCAGDEGTDGASRVLRHTFEPFEVDPGEEIAWMCQSWTLDNEEPLFVRRITAENDGAWHHSNWFYFRETSFRGPDGTWDCEERDFDEVGAALQGGVFFAQSTQAGMETQAFPPGAALELPAHARVAGDVHLLNFQSEPVRTSMTFEVETIPEEEVEVRLRPMSFSHLGLAIPPRSESRFSMECDVASTYRDQLGRDPDFSIYYVLPHYHELGNYFRLELVGGERDGEVIYETAQTVGEPLGMMMDPPIDLSGAERIRLTCGYDNPRDEVVRYGIGDQEMCVFLAFTDAPLAFAGRANDNEEVGTEGGIVMNESTCDLFGLRPL